HLLPTLWLRRKGPWSRDGSSPVLRAAPDAPDTVIAASHPDLGLRRLHCEGTVPLLFTENETNTERVFGEPNTSRTVKAGTTDYVVQGRTTAATPDRVGSKAAAHYRLNVGRGEPAVVRLRLTDASQATASPFGPEFDETFATRLREADAFYAA